MSAISKSEAKSSSSRTDNKQAPRSGWVISANSTKFGVVPHCAGAKIQNSASLKLCPPTKEGSSLVWGHNF